MEEKSYKEYLEHITTFIFDVDGVLTDGTITVTTTGEMLRTMNIKDGYAIKTAIDSGFNLCIISGGTNEGVRIRLEGLGVKDIYLGAHNKIEQLSDYLQSKNIHSITYPLIHSLSYALLPSLRSTCSRPCPACPPN